VDDLRLVSAAVGIAVARAPDFTLPTPDGDEVSLTSLRGGKVIRDPTKVLASIRERLLILPG
jgi:hypothetical protein